MNDIKEKKEVRKNIEGYTERRKAVDKRGEERKEPWNILEG